MNKRIKGVRLLPLCQILTQNNVIPSDKLANAVTQYMDDGDAKKFRDFLDGYNLIGYEDVVHEMTKLLYQQ